MFRMVGENYRRATMRTRRPILTSKRINHRQKMVINNGEEAKSVKEEEDG